MTNFFDVIEDVVMLVGVESNGTYHLLLANQAFMDGVGKRKEECLGKDVATLITTPSYTFLVTNFREVITTRQPVRSTTWLNVPYGRRAFECNFIPILNTVGECVQITAIIHDITELQQLRREVKRLRAKLDDTKTTP